MRQYQKAKSFSNVPGNLKALRGDLSQAEFASYLGISNQVTYHRYESGRVPKAEVLHQIATRMGIALDELLLPIPADRARAIQTQTVVQNFLPSDPKQKISEESARAFGQAAGELINEKSTKALTSLLKLDRAPYDEISRLSSHLISARNKAPTEFAKYYSVLIHAVMMQLARHLKLEKSWYSANPEGEK